VDRARLAIVYSGTHESALERLLTNQTDVAALAEAPWRTLQADRPAEAAGLVEIWRSSPLPPGPVICVRDNDTPCDAIAQRLLRNDGDSREAASGLAQGWSETVGAHAFERFRTDNYHRFIH